MVEIATEEIVESAEEAALNSAKRESLQKAGIHAYRKMGWGLVILLLAQIVAPIFMWLLHDIAPWIANDDTTNILITYISLYLIGLPIMCSFLRSLPDHPAGPCLGEEEKPNARRILGLYAVLSVISIFVIQIFEVIRELFYMGEGTPEPLASNANPIVLFVIVVIVAPIMEEHVFRYLTYHKLSGYGSRYYILWSGIAFGLFHGYVVQSLYAAVMGIAFAIVMYRSGRIRGSIVLHMLINLSSSFGLVGLLMEYGGDAGLVIIGIFNIAVFVIGVVLGILYISRGIFKLNIGEGAPIITNWRQAFWNPSYIVFALICIAMMAFVGI